MSYGGCGYARLWSGGAGLPMAALCFWGMHLQVSKRLVMVASRWCWVADGGTVLLGNAIANLMAASRWLCGNCTQGNASRLS